MLASVLAPSEKKNYMLIDPQKESAGVIQTALINAGAVVGSADSAVAIVVEVVPPAVFRP